MKEYVGRLTETSLLVAATVVLFFLAFVPLVGLLFAPFSPLPLSLAVMRNGVRFGILGAATALLVVFLFSGVLAVCFVPFLFMGLFVGVGLARGWSGEKILAWGICALSVVLLLFSAGVEWYLHRTPGVRTIRERVEDVFRESERFVEARLSGALEPQVLRRMKHDLALMRRVAVKIVEFPLMLCFCMASVAVSIYWFVVWMVLRRLGMREGPLCEPSRWRLPWYSVWPLILSYMAYEWASARRPAVALAALNLLGVCFICFVVVGFSVLWGILRKRKMAFPVAAFIMAFSVIFLTLPPYPLVPLLGLLDPWFDFRGLDAGGDVEETAR